MSWSFGGLTLTGSTQRLCIDGKKEMTRNLTVYSGSYSPFVIVNRLLCKWAIKRRQSLSSPQMSSQIKLCSSLVNDCNS